MVTCGDKIRYIPTMDKELTNKISRSCILLLLKWINFRDKGKSLLARNTVRVKGVMVKDWTCIFQHEF